MHINIFLPSGWVFAIFFFQISYEELSPISNETILQYQLIKQRTRENGKGRAWVRERERAKLSVEEKEEKRGEREKKIIQASGT